jgi:hypothetical protein
VRYWKTSSGDILTTAQAGKRNHERLRLYLTEGHGPRSMDRHQMINVGYVVRSEGGWIARGTDLSKIRKRPYEDLGKAGDALVRRAEG